VVHTIVTVFDGTRNHPERKAHAVTCTKNVRLRARDHDLFETLLERRVETLGHLHRVVFPDNARETTRNRLVRLRQAGYVDRLAIEDLPADLLASGDLNHPQASVYRLTAKGITALRLRHRAAAQLRGGPGPGHLSEASIPHQFAVNRVGDWLDVERPRPHPRQGRHHPHQRQRPRRTHHHPRPGPRRQGRCLDPTGPRRRRDAPPQVPHVR